MSSTTTRICLAIISVLIASLVGLYLIGVIEVGANDTIPEETAQPTITEDMGTVTPPTPVVEDDDIYMLPNTGAGTTAREVRSGKWGTGWHVLGYQTIGSGYYAYTCWQNAYRGIHSPPTSCYYRYLHAAG